MSNLPRLLPLIAVAVGGVLLVRAVGSVEAMPDLLKSATAWAEGDATPAADKAKDAEAAGDRKATDEAAAAGASETDASAISILDAAEDAATKAPAPVCATSVDDLARQAGISPSELQVLQSLAARRAQLDAREKELKTQEQLIAAAEAKLDGRIKQMTAIKGDVQALLDQANKAADDDVMRMVKVYESMKPKDAAKVFETLRDDVRLPIAAKMKERSLAAVLAQMSPATARDLTEKLASRMKKADGLQAQLDKAAPATPPAAKPAPKPAAPAKPNP